MVDLGLPAGREGRLGQYEGPAATSPGGVGPSYCLPRLVRARRRCGDVCAGGRSSSDL